MFKPSMTSLKHITLAASLTVLPVQNALSAPGTLPSAPLFLSTLVEPNLFVTLDDSGSMDWELLVDDGVSGFATDSGLPIISTRQRAYLNPTFSQLYNNRYVLPPANGTDPEWDKGWIFRNHIANKNYYNPGKRYDPWAGTLANGDPMFKPFTDFTKIPKDPNKTGTGDEFVDLTVKHAFSEGGHSTSIYLPTYYVWPDTEGDGVIEHTDAHTRVEISTTDTVVIDGETINVMQNFANWFVYHRSRINVSKYVIGRAISRTDAARIGLVAFNQSLLSTSASMTDAANRRALLNALYGLEVPAKGTPTRTALETVGEYFANNIAGFTTPILPKADGGECQQNFNILMSDGFWNGVNPSVGNADENDATSPFDGNASQSNDGGNYADGYSNTLADVAMHYYETDLSNLDNLVPTQAGIDEADHQHLVTYTIGFGLKGSLDPATLNPLADGFSWPEPVSGSITTVDDMWHASYNSRGKHLSADNPDEFEASLDAAITDISERTGTAAAVAVNSAQLNLDSVIYLAQFNSNRWQGNLLALPILFNPDGTTNGELGSPKWEASEKLTARNINTNPRTIITYNNSPSKLDGVPFQWADISTDMINDLNTNAVGTKDTNGEKRLDYLRGDRSNEGAGAFFRPRLSLLGDIVNSGPVFVGEPDLAWPDFAPFPTGTAAYSEFKNGPAKTRKKIVYVGANDGMLHAFDDDSGEEVFAYVPHMVTSSGIAGGLHYLTDPNYGHKFYVDQSPAVSDVYISHATDPAKWRTVLVGAMRSGARGVFALDVTNPANFSEANAANMVLWEFSSTDDADLGFTYSRPFIALANNNTWVAIFGNGYNDLGSGEASLFIVDIEKGADGKWQAGDYTKISTGVGSAADRNGLATPALADIDGNGTVDRVYAGDLRGNVWVFDLEATNSSSWGVAHKSGSTPIPFFTTDSNRPITSRPVLAKHPTQPDSTSPSNAPNIMVYVGTGQYLVSGDKSTTDVDTFYGVWDKGDASRNSSHLIEQTFLSGFADAQGNAARVLTRNAVDYSTDYGWYFRLLPDSGVPEGERSVTSPVARADTVFFNTFIPVDQPCSIGGSGFRFAVDMATGGSALAEDPVFDANNDNIIDANDTVSDGNNNTSTLAAVAQDGYLPAPVFVENSKDSLAFTGEEGTKIKGLKDIPVGRFSWQELLQ